MSVDPSRAGISFGANSIRRGVRRDRGGPIRNRPGSTLMTRPGSPGQRVAASVIGFTSLLASVLVLIVAGHLARPALGVLSEQIILVIASIAAMTCVIGSLLIHGRRTVYWLFFCGFLLSPIAQAHDDPLLMAVGVAFFVGPLAWNMFLLRRLIKEEGSRCEGVETTHH